MRSDLWSASITMACRTLGSLSGATPAGLIKILGAVALGAVVKDQGRGLILHPFDGCPHYGHHWGRIYQDGWK